MNEVIYDTIPCYRLNYSPERYSENLLLPSKPSLDENIQSMKKLNLIEKDKHNKWNYQTMKLYKKMENVEVIATETHNYHTNMKLLA